MVLSESGKEEKAVAGEPEGPWKDWIPEVLNNAQLAENLPLRCVAVFCLIAPTGQPETMMI